jgi:hypothetical protein
VPPFLSFEVPWACLLDCAPKHTGKLFRASMREHMDEVPLVYVDCNQTGGLQPLDCAVMKPWKDELRKAASGDLATMLIDGVDDFASIMNKPGLKNKIVQWVTSDIDKTKDKERMYAKAWEHLVVPEEELEDVLLHAEELNHAGQLFKPQQHGIVPEHVPGDDEPDHQLDEDAQEVPWNMHAEDEEA